MFPDRLFERVNVKTIGSWPCSAPFASVAATVTSASLSAMVPVALAGAPGV